MTEEKYISLIHKQLNGELSASEFVELESWLNESADNKQHFDSYKAIWSLTEGSDDAIEVDVDKAFAKFKGNIDTSATIKKFESPVAKVVPMRRRVLQLAAALAILLGSGFIFNLIINSQEIASFDLVIVMTEANEKKELRLPDGTIVFINQNSTFKYPSLFTEDTRSVTLTGEAFFDVAKDASKPFIIDTEKTQVTVLGTSFNVREYLAEAVTEVMVKTGTVKFSPKDKNEAVQLTKYKKGIYFHNKKELKKTTVNHFNDMAWQSGEVKFQSMELRSVMENLERQYNTSIQFENNALLDCEFTGTFKSNMKINQIVSAISQSFGAGNPRYSEKENTYTVSGGQCIHK